MKTAHGSLMSLSLVIANPLHFGLNFVYLEKDLEIEIEVRNSHIINFSYC